MGVPTVFTDYCEEAAYLASLCIGTVSGHPSKKPVISLDNIPFSWHVL
jgi:zinc finger MYND domain-containing protein 15